MITDKQKRNKKILKRIGFQNETTVPWTTQGKIYWSDQ